MRRKDEQKLVSWALLTVSLFTALVGSSAAANLTFSKPNYKLYHNKEQVFDRLRRVVSTHPSSFQVEELRAGDDKYNSTLTVITVEPSGRSEDHSHKLRLLLDFGEHGRELVTVEVALRLMDLLADPGMLEQAANARSSNLQKLLAMLEHCVFKIVVMENVHGRETVEKGNLCERKNGRGVDSNRNWPVHWGFREKDYDPSEEYPGLAPFSEPEVQMLNSLAKSFEPHVWMNMHSGMEALFMPYDHIAALPDDAAGRASLQLLQALNKLKCDSRCATGSGGTSVGYLAHGTATDFMHDVLGVPFSFTWEIYGDTQAHFLDCFKMFNPITAEHLEQVVSNWADAVLAMVELLPSSEHGTAAGYKPFHRKILPTSLTKQGSNVYNHTETDEAQEVRQARLASVFAIVAEVEQSVGIVPEDDTWDGFLSRTPLLAWLGVICFAFIVWGLIASRSGRTRLKGIRRK